MRRASSDRAAGELCPLRAGRRYSRYSRYSRYIRYSRYSRYSLLRAGGERPADTGRDARNLERWDPSPLAGRSESRAAEDRGTSRAPMNA